MEIYTEKIEAAQDFEALCNIVEEAADDGGMTMKKTCENCAKVETCKKDIGIIWGFCNTDFQPKKKED